MVDFNHKTWRKTICITMSLLVSSSLWFRLPMQCPYQVIWNSVCFNNLVALGFQSVEHEIRRFIDFVRAERSFVTGRTPCAQLRTVISILSHSAFSSLSTWYSMSVIEFLNAACWDAASMVLLITIYGMVYNALVIRLFHTTAVWTQHCGRNILDKQWRQMTGVYKVPRFLRITVT